MKKIVSIFTLIFCAIIAALIAVPLIEASFVIKFHSENFDGFIDFSYLSIVKLSLVSLMFVLSIFFTILLKPHKKIALLYENQKQDIPLLVFSLLIPVASAISLFIFSFFYNGYSETERILELLALAFISLSFLYEIHTRANHKLHKSATIFFTSSLTAISLCTVSAVLNITLFIFTNKVSGDLGIIFYIIFLLYAIRQPIILVRFLTRKAKKEATIDKEKVNNTSLNDTFSELNQKLENNKNDENYNFSSQSKYNSFLEKVYTKKSDITNKYKKNPNSLIKENSTYYSKTIFASKYKNTDSRYQGEVVDTIIDMPQIPAIYRYKMPRKFKIKKIKASKKSLLKTFISFIRRLIYGESDEDKELKKALYSWQKGEIEKDENIHLPAEIFLDFYLFSQTDKPIYYSENKEKYEENAELKNDNSSQMTTQNKSANHIENKKAKRKKKPKEN